VRYVPAKKNEIPIIEPAKSGRASCRGCRRKILKGEYRIGIPYQFTRPDGESITSFGYYHPECAPQDNIKVIIEILEKKSIDSADKDKIRESMRKGLEEGPQTSSALQQKAFLEPSKSARGNCRICEKKIEKGILRVAEPTRIELEDGRKFFSHKFFHVKCYLESKSEIQSIFQNLVQTSLERRSIVQEEAETIKEEFQEFLTAGETAAVVIDLITEEPIELELLKTIAKEKGVPFSAVKRAIENGLLNGVYFEPTPGKIQKL
jgi:poly [ADP-ribose] polymerase